MEHARTEFLYSIIGKRLPPEIISIVRDYDPIYRDYFNKNIIQSLSFRVNDFWHNKYMKSLRSEEEYVRKIGYYYIMMSRIVYIQPHYTEGLFVLD
jgi:hypothetical protein